ncbi:conserved hypothetical protein [Flavobacterium psychrophilum]|uniref:BREX-1 system adenine-specific DNA-methyltransferase PglX n=1 Tax=Flavobacterium psychrophilum TaxID=96345 RepID=UPI000B7C0DD6|nr:BREX-1 system adenine-specific DNA-methyltransferase PglX [Flavobacterium psychrophilum]SNB43070.1 conserved hypothetical protein [Flavobacterium psychrophilum]
MKLADHTEHIRKLIDTAFRNRLGRMGVSENGLLPVDTIPAEYRADRKRIETIREVFIKETGTVAEAFEKLVEELTFTLFNRLAALKVMEAHTLHPEIVTRRTQHGDRSFAHLAWLEQNSDARNTDAEGLLDFFEQQLTKLENDIPLFSPKHPYHLMPTAVELNTIINAFNQIETDTQVDNEIWKSDDVLGWLYESYNTFKKEKHDESGLKTEYNKVSIQSQYYTPKWVVKFLIDNTLGKFYQEMYPYSAIKEKYKIANLPATKTREHKPLHEIRLIDPSNGSGNFLLYAFDVFYDLYLDNINEQGNPDNYDEANIAKFIIENNLHGVDLDDRAVQLAQLGLYIKAKRKKRNIKIDHFNVVSSDFFLPEYSEVKDLFENGAPLDPQLEKIVTDLWKDLQQAYKFGTLIRLEEKFNLQLHGLVAEFSGTQVKLFTEETLASYEQFRENFFGNLQKAVTQNTANQGQTFLNTKTQDAITFLSILTQKYDIAVANPPYTDSADFGPELKSFIEDNYKKPYKFNANLYAAFIKRCSELVNPDGYLGLLHPLTFMYISSFKEVRKYILTKTTIDTLAELGLGGVFANVQADVVAYTLKNSKSEANSAFLDFKKYKNHTNKPDIFAAAFDNLVNNITDEHIYKLSQNSFKEIDAWPFIYWISDKFRKKFKGGVVNDYLFVVKGLTTSDNLRFLRLWWEVDQDCISEDYSKDKKKWVRYAKGGPFEKWYGNNWAVLNWADNGSEVKNFQASVVRNEIHHLEEGITYTASGSKGASYRYLPENFITDAGGPGIFTNKYTNINYLLGFFNSFLISYIADCLNPTVNINQGDIWRIPFVVPNKDYENKISSLASKCVEIKEKICSYKITETNFIQNPINSFTDNSIKERLINFLNFENKELTKLLICEALINKLVFEVYELNDNDKDKVEIKMGKPVGSLPLISTAKNEFIENNNDLLSEYTRTLSEIKFDENFIREIKENFNSLYKGNSNLEEFCIKYQVNPINVWYWFKEEKFLPDSVASEYALEFLADTFRTLLMEDEDGIIPLVGLPDEPRLSERLEQYCLQNGFTSAQFLQLDGLLGKPLNQYIEHYFFSAFADHVKLFKQMPSTPFIWHLSSGKHQGFEAYIIIYKWNRDSLFKLKTQYLSHRVENLEYRLIQLQDVNTAQAQNEKETIRHQLDEIKVFTAKIDELIAEGYDPKLDDGVGKNIAPLQKKGLLRADVLKAPQLVKYLNADW